MAVLMAVLARHVAVLATHHVMTLPHLQDAQDACQLVQVVAQTRVVAAVQIHVVRVARAVVLAPVEVDVLQVAQGVADMDVVQDAHLLVLADAIKVVHLHVLENAEGHLVVASVPTYAIEVSAMAVARGLVKTLVKERAFILVV